MESAKPFTTEGLVVSFLLKKAKEARSDGLTPLHINKLVYICHGWVLGYFDRPLIDNSDKHIQAWMYGPVVVSVYHRLKHFGRSPISFEELCSHLADTVAIDISLLRTDYERIITEKLGSFERRFPQVFELLEWVYENYGSYDGAQLIDITHQEGTPWHQCYKNRGLRGRIGRGISIPDKIIKAYYEKRISE